MLFINAVHASRIFSLTSSLMPESDARDCDNRFYGHELYNRSMLSVCYKRTSILRAASSMALSMLLNSDSIMSAIISVPSVFLLRSCIIVVIFCNLSRTASISAVTSEGSAALCNDAKSVWTSWLQALISSVMPLDVFYNRIKY